MPRSDAGVVMIRAPPIENAVAMPTIRPFLVHAMGISGSDFAARCALHRECTVHAIDTSFPGLCHEKRPCDDAALRHERSVHAIDLSVQCLSWNSVEAPDRVVQYALRRERSLNANIVSFRCPRPY